MKDSDGGSGVRIGFCGLLTLVFIVLKLTGVISWSWIWVLAPVWASALVWISIFVAIALIERRS